MASCCVTALQEHVRRLRLHCSPHHVHMLAAYLACSPPLSGTLTELIMPADHQGRQEVFQESTCHLIASCCMEAIPGRSGRSRQPPGSGLISSAAGPQRQLEPKPILACAGKPLCRFQKVVFCKRLEVACVDAEMFLYELMYKTFVHADVTAKLQDAISVADKH